MNPTSTQPTPAASPPALQAQAPPSVPIGSSSVAAYANVAAATLDLGHRTYSGTAPATMRRP